MYINLKLIETNLSLINGPDPPPVRLAEHNKKQPTSTQQAMYCMCGW